MHTTFIRLAAIAAGCLLYGQLCAQPWDPAMRPGTDLRQPAPAGLNVQTSASTDLSKIRTADYQKLGWQYNLFAMNIPMAWSITKGKQDVTVAVSDGNFDQPDISVSNTAFPSHPDISIRNFGSSTGNFLWLSEPHRANGNSLAVYGINDGSNTTNLYGTGLVGSNGHGFSILSLSIARENGQGMVGIAPQARVVGVGSITGAANATVLVDMDGQSNGVLMVPDVLAISRLERPNIPEDQHPSTRKSVEEGIVAVVGSGNAMGVLTPRSFMFDVNTPCGSNNFKYWRMGSPGTSFPNNSVWEDLDTKPISVGVVSNGELVNSCGMYRSGDTWIFPDNHTYAPGREKFPAPGSTFLRERKQQAFIDIVVPQNEISASFGLLNSNDKYSYDANAPQFSHGNAGTSEATGQLAGVVALMRSVDKFLGVSIGGNGLPLSKPDVHKKAYVILTFTARKIEDIENSARALQVTGPPELGTDTNKVVYVLPGNLCWEYNKINFSDFDPKNVVPENDLKNPQLHYVVQTYDNLKRTWAQRMGFGMVDAFRAVAHSIPVKANYQYQSSTTLSSGHLLNNRYYVHFGSKINEQLDLASGEDRNGGGQQNVELKVLEWGGADLPGQIHNNQGVTRIEGGASSITVSVPQNYVATIDGIVRTANNSNTRSIVTGAGSGASNDHGLVLLAGMLDGVEVRGRIRAGDVLVNPVSNNTTGLVFQNHGSPSDPLAKVGSEIYGVVTLKNNASLVVDNNATLTLQPGGTIDIQGNQNVVVKSGATLVMEYPSTIKGSGLVVVENGGKLIIKAKPSPDRLWKTEVLAEVVIQDGGEMLVEEKALVEMGGNATAVTVNEGGIFRCLPESHVVLRDGSTLWCNGKFLAVGQNNRKVVFTSDVDACGGVVPKSAATIYTYTTGTGALTGSLLDIKYCTFANISVWAVDMPSTLMEHCSFTTNRENPIRTLFTKWQWQQSPFLFVPTSVTDVEIRNCSFADVKGDIDENQWRGDDDYAVSGAVLHGLQKVTVENSNFDFMMSGVSTRLCDKVVVRENAFSTSNYGLHDDGSAVLFCKNTCIKTERGNAQEFSRVSLTVDNNYTNVWSATYGKSAATQFVRNNTVKDFREGVFAETSPFVLRPQRAYNPPFVCYDARVEHGYNNFISDDATHWSSEFLEKRPGGGNQRIQGQQRDIRLKDNAVLDIERGYNLLSLLSGDHLYKEDAPVQSVNVNYNAWSGPMGFILRHNPNINPIGTILNQEEDINEYCGTLYGCAPIADAIVCPSDPYTNDGSWVERVSTDPYLQQVYTHARQQMQNPALDVMCRRVKAHDALQVATIGEQKETKFRQLLVDYAAISADVSAPSDVQSVALVLKGETHERLGEKTQAIAAYTAATNSYPTSSDAEVAAWRLHFLAASTTGTVGSTSYEQAMAGYRQRVLDDMRGSSAPGPHKRGEEAIAGMNVEGATSLFAPVPNPSNGEIEVVYALGRAGVVHISIVDVLGRVKARLDSFTTHGEQPAGTHRVQFDGKHLPMGVYTLRMEVAGVVYSQPLVIVK